MKATIVPDIDETEEPGAVEIRRMPDGFDRAGEICGLAICCPGCGEKSWLPVRKENKSDHDWQLQSEDPLHIEPSVFHTKERGGCGWHGYLRNGEWKPC